MAQPLEPKRIRAIGLGGMIRQAEVDDALIPNEAVTESINFHFDRKGAASVRPGIASLGGTSVVTGSGLGIANAQNSTLIIASAQGSVTSITIYALSGASWAASMTDTSGISTRSKMRFVDFSNRTIRLSGTESSIRCWTGSANGDSYWESSGNPINPQQLWYANGNTATGYIRPKYGEVFKSRVYLAGDSVYPDRLYFSSVISSTGNITWAPAFDYVDINPNDGENITGLKRYSSELLVFKPNNMYRFRVSSVEPDPLIRVGTRSHESIVEGKRGLYFHNDIGFFRYTGGYPDEISRPLKDLFDAINFDNLEDISAWKDNDHIYWSVGNLVDSDGLAVRINDTVYRNCVFRYTESSEIWTVYLYPFRIAQATSYKGPDDKFFSQVGISTNTGGIFTLNSGTTDQGEPIKYRLITKWYEWGEVYNQKVIKNLIALCEKAQGMILMYQVDDKDWQEIGQLRKYANHFEKLSIVFNRIRFKVAGVSSNEPPVFLGIEVPEIINEGIVKK